MPGSPARVRVRAGPWHKLAISVAAFAELLKQSPYAQPERLADLAATFSNPRERDEDRLEFDELFRQARPLLPAP